MDADNGGVTRAWHCLGHWKPPNTEMHSEEVLTITLGLLTATW